MATANRATMTRATTRTNSESPAAARRSVGLRPGHFPPASAGRVLQPASFCSSAGTQATMYRTIDTTCLWDDPKVKPLCADAKLLFVYLVTNRHAHLSGIYYLLPAAIVKETGLSAKRLDTPIR